MDVTGLLIGLLNVMMGLLVVAVSLPLVRGKVGMNHSYGIRVRQSFESEEKWFKINRYGGRQLMIWGAIIAALGVVTMFLDVDGLGDGMLLLLFVPLLILVPAVQSIFYARKA